MTLSSPGNIDHRYKAKRYRFRKTQQCAEMERTMRIVNALTAEKEKVTSDSGYELLPHDLATGSLYLAESQITNPDQKASLRRDCLDALEAALDVRIQQPQLFTATNLEACSDVVGLYTEIDVYTCYVNGRFNSQRKLHDMDFRVTRGSANSVVVDAKTSGCCSASRTALTGHANSLVEANVSVEMENDTH